MRLVPIIFLSFLLFTYPSYATTCIGSDPLKEIQKTSQIFKGKLIRTSTFKPTDHLDMGLTNFETFQVEKIYKGTSSDTIDVYFSGNSPAAPRQLSEGEEYIVFASPTVPNGKLIRSFCSRTIELNKVHEFTHEETPRLVAELEIIAGQIEALDRLIQQFPENGWLYVRKGEILDQNQDFKGAAIQFGQALNLIRTKMPVWMSERRHEAEERVAIDYIRTLYESGNYSEIEAQIPLALRDATPSDHGFTADGRKLVKKYLAATYIREGKKLEIRPLVPIDVSGLNLDKTDLTGFVLDDSNFSGTSLEGSNFANASLKGSDFRGANLLYVNYKESDLTGAQYDCTSKLGNTNNPTASGQMVGPAHCW